MSPVLCAREGCCRGSGSSKFRINVFGMLSFGEERDCSKGRKLFGYIVLWRGLGIKSLLDDLQLWNHDTTQSLEQPVRNIRMHTLESINPAMSSAVI